MADRSSFHSNFLDVPRAGDYIIAYPLVYEILSVRCYEDIAGREVDVCVLAVKLKREKAFEVDLKDRRAWLYDSLIANKYMVVIVDIEK